MPDVFTTLRTDVNSILSYGEQIRFRHFTGSKSSTAYDDEQVLSKSGNDVMVSGLVFPIKSVQGSHEAVLLEQGKIKTDDKIIFVNGATETTNTMKIGINGSPPSEEYSLIPNGILAYPAVGNIVYKKIYCRYLPAGSLSGEA